jgi:hypothetical protein
MSTTRAQRKKEISVPATFVPRFWDGQDGRALAVREINRRLELLKEDVGADSFQKELLCQEAIFIALQLETMRVTALQTGKIDLGIYTQATNALSGLLSKLGLDRQRKQTTDLRAYVKERQR